MSTTTNRKKKKQKSDAHTAVQQGRLLALQMMYAFDQKSYENDGALLLDDADAASEKEALAKAKSLFDGFCAEQVAIDAGIEKNLQNWTLERLAHLDRAVLRLGCYELIYCSDVPPRVIINEYIELAKQFGSEARTAKLVNGVLDTIAREHRADEVKPKK